jgi:hypothetical protein
MNAFHPQFMATYYPDFWRLQIAASKSPQAATAERKSKRAAKLKPKDFFIFARAVCLKVS